MEVKDITGLLGRVAPWLAAAATGPVGLAGMAIKTVAGVLGTSDESIEGVAQAISGAKPEQIAELRKADIEFKLKMQELGFQNIKDMAQISAADRADARKSNVTSGMNRHVFWLSVILLLACLGAEIAVLFTGYPPTIPDLVVGRVLGLADGVTMLVLAYWFGTTNGSSQKTELLASAPPVQR